MSDHELAFLALLGASAAATGGVYLSGRGPVERPSVWYRLLWPREVDSDGVTAFLASSPVTGAVTSSLSRSWPPDGHLSYRHRYR